MSKKKIQSTISCLIFCSYLFFVLLVAGLHSQRSVTEAPPKFQDLEDAAKRSVARYILGYGNLDFYMSEETVREILARDNIATDNQIEEKLAEVYVYPDYNQDFVLFDHFRSSFIDFSFSDLPMKTFLERQRERGNKRESTTSLQIRCRQV